LGALAAAVAAGVCANAGKKANANRPSQSEIVRFICFSLERREPESARSKN
jgi:F0F1-type ATP synthase membrane subunit c/vacuolar-type H+-ATPase subunit K